MYIYLNVLQKKDASFKAGECISNLILDPMGVAENMEIWHLKLEFFPFWQFK